MATSIASALLSAVGLTPFAPTTTGPAAQALVWPAVTPVLTSGSVQTTDGGWDRTTSPATRVVVYAAPETTLRDIATIVHGWLVTVGAPVDVAGTGRALLAYNSADLDVAAVVGGGLAVSPTTFPAWQVGHAVALPIEFDATAATPTFTTDPALWTQLAGSFDAGYEALLDYLPGPLALPDHDADDTWAATTVSGAATLADLAPMVRTTVLTNPSAAVYRMLALLRHLDAAADATACLTTLVSTEFDPAELSLLASLRPGSVVLRALYRRLATATSTPAIDAAVAALLTGFGFTPGSATIDLTTAGPPVIARELPTSTAWRVRADKTKPSFDVNSERTDGRHDLVLGRSIHCGRVATETYHGISYRGPAYAGKTGWTAAQFMAAHGSELNPSNDTTLTARLAVVAVIAPNEGNIDAVRLRDRAILAVGIQQWSADSDTELTPLLWQFAQQYPDDYAAHFGIYGLGLVDSADYPNGGGPQSVSMTSVAPGGTAVAMPGTSAAHPGIPPERLAFFGGHQVDAHHYQWVDPADDSLLTPWAARVRNAELCSRGLQLLEVLEAARRFTKIVGEQRHWTVGGAPFTIDTLITSQQGAAQLLDQHINTPKNAAQNIKDAAQAVTVTPALDAQGAPTDEWLTAFEAAYLEAVRYPAGIPKHDVHDPATNKLIARGRQDRILAAHLDPSVHSFGGW